MQPQLTDDLLRVIIDLGNRIEIAEKSLTNDAVQVGMGVLWPASAGLLPVNYHLADGTAIDRIGYAALFQQIGTTYGVGDGATTFGLPTWTVSQQSNSNEEISYVEFTSNVTVSAGVGSPNTVVTAGAFTPNGTDVYWIEFFASLVASGANDSVTCELYDGATRLGKMLVVATNSATLGSDQISVLARRKITPTNASHTYSIKAYIGGAASGVIFAGSGAAGTQMPGYILITSADNHVAANDIPVAIKIL